MTEQALRTGSHDLTPSAEFQAFMTHDWAAGPLSGELLLPAARFTPSAVPGCPPAFRASDC